MSSFINVPNHEIASHGLSNYIMEQPPYNILHDIHEDMDGKLIARVKNEYRCEGEAIPIGVAEAGRHIAIAGSMILARDYGFEEAHYYLANHAVFNRNLEVNDDSEHFLVEVEVVDKSKRKGKIKGELIDVKDRTIFTANIQYSVLSQSVFSKLFEKHKPQSFYPEKINRNSPYQNRKKLVNVAVEKNTLASGIYETIHPFECKGHFPEYPALPIAIMASHFSELSIKLFNSSTTNKYGSVIIRNASINANRLVFAGETVHFLIKVKEMIDSNCMTVVGTAKVNDEIVSEIESELHRLA